MTNTPNQATVDIYQNIPQELKERRQWVLWKFVQKQDRQKPTKVPYQINHQKADTTEPETWGTFEEVVRTLQETGQYNGIGYVFSKDDPYTGVDFDNCVREGRDIHERVREDLQRFNTYAERSQSRDGIHAIVRADLPSRTGRKTKKNGYEIEVYNWGRFFVMTGNYIKGTPPIIEPRQDELNEWFAENFPAQGERRQRNEEFHGESPNLTDDQIIEKASNARNGEVFKKFFYGGPESDHSSSDLALCNILAFYTQDFDQIDRIFRGSALMRDKWDEKRGQYYYNEKTIHKALLDLTETYNPARNRQQVEIENDEGLRPIIPEGWEFGQNDSLYMKRKNSKGEELPAALVTHEPIIISGRYLNYTNKTQGLVLSWKKEGRWFKKKIRREDAMIHNQLMKLSADGVPVNTVNARNLVRYLYDFESANSHQIPLNLAAEQNGWINKGFLLGKTFIDKEGNEQSQKDQGSVYILEPSDAEMKITKELTAKGTIEGQLDIFERLKNYYRVTAGIYASLASPLLRILRATPFVMEWAYETSKGKTIAMQVAASVWGNPNENQGIIKTWNTTHVGVERTVSFMNDLPTFLDDTKKQPKKDILNDVVYQHSSGMGKIRGTKDGGVQEIKTWNNILITTGENKITSFKADGGAAARALSIAEMPFGKADEESYFFVNQIKNDVEDHYGHIGKEFIKYLIQHSDNWDTLRQKHQELKKEYMNRVQNFNTVAARMGDIMATLHIAAMIFQKCFGLNWGYEGLYKLWDEILSDENTETDRPKEAVQSVYSWAIANELMFHRNLNEPRPVGCLGEWNPQDERKEWDAIAFNPEGIEEYLKRKGYDPRATFKSWKDREWLICSKGRGFRLQVKRKGVRMDYICVKREALEQ